MDTGVSHIFDIDPYAYLGLIYALLISINSYKMNQIKELYLYNAYFVFYTNHLLMSFMNHIFAL
jgi:hypothetical protein